MNTSKLRSTNISKNFSQYSYIFLHLLQPSVLQNYFHPTTLNISIFYSQRIFILKLSILRPSSSSSFSLTQLSFIQSSSSRLSLTLLLSSNFRQYSNLLFFELLKVHFFRSFFLLLKLLLQNSFKL